MSKDLNEEIKRILDEASSTIIPPNAKPFTMKNGYTNTGVAKVAPKAGSLLGKAAGAVGGVLGKAAGPIGWALSPISDATPANAGEDEFARQEKYGNAPKPAGTKPAPASTATPPKSSAPAKPQSFGDAYKAARAKAAASGNASTGQFEYGGKKYQTNMGKEKYVPASQQKQVSSTASAPKPATTAAPLPPKKPDAFKITPDQVKQNPDIGNVRTGKDFFDVKSMTQKLSAAPLPPSRPKDIGTPKIDWKPPEEIQKLKQKQNIGASTVNKEETNPLIAAFLKLQDTKHPNIFEAAKKAKKDWDGDGKVESDKDEVWGSRLKAAKEAGKLKEEEELDEVSKKTLGSYIKKATSKVGYHSKQAAHTNDIGNQEYHYKKAEKREKGVSKAVDKLTKEEVEEIDEVSKKTLGSYVKKAEKQVKKDSDVMFNPSNKTYRDAEKGDPDAEEKYSKASVRYDKRLSGVSMAKKKMKEEVEEIDEVSKETLGSYVKRNKEDQDAIGFNLNWKPSGSRAFKDAYNDLPKRTKGLKTAEDKLAGKARVNATEEVEFSEAEIAHIEAILGEGRKPKDAPPEEKQEGRDARQHIQIVAGQAAAGREIEFTHNNGEKTKISPSMGRMIVSKLNGMKPAERQAAVNKMHDSAAGLK